MSRDAATEAWVAHRNLLFTVAYEMLGSADDAEDVLQEVWLRWADVPVEEVRDTRAYLVRITTRLALNQLRSRSRRREEYVGPWLPAPLLTTPDVAEDVELAESLSTAMLLVLETLSPLQNPKRSIYSYPNRGYNQQGFLFECYTHVLGSRRIAPQPSAQYSLATYYQSIGLLPP